MRSARGFSLLELLASVAILAVLAAFGSSYMAGMRTRANTTASIGNLRQIGMAVNAYVTDNDGRLPDKSWESGHEPWIRSLYGKIYNTAWPDFVPYDTGANLKGTVFYSPNLKSAEPKPWRSYGWNNFLQFTESTGVTLPPKVSVIPHPAKLILVGDSLQSSSLYPDKLSFRNDGKCLLLMADFHVVAKTAEQLPSNSYDPAWRVSP